MARRTRGQWRQRARCAGVALLAGALINIGVAWWYTALTIDDVIPGNRPLRHVELVNERWPVQVPDSWALPQWRSECFYRPGYSLLAWEYTWFRAHPNEEMDPRAPEAAVYSFASFRSGWPLKSMEWVQRSETWMGKERQERSWNRSRGKAELPAWCRSAMTAITDREVTLWRLPLIPIWPGFAVNTLMYASAAYSGLLSLSAAQRMLRTRHGRCAECGYLLAGLLTCPECGQQAP